MAPLATFFILLESPSMSEYGWGALGWFSNVLAYGEEIIEY
jgi:hypothetical protein